jgi:hypothetical protein
MNINLNYMRIIMNIMNYMTIMNYINIVNMNIVNTERNGHSHGNQEYLKVCVMGLGRK